MKQDRIDRLVNRNIIIFTKNNFRFQGIVKGYDGKFIEIHDDVKGKNKILNVDEISEVEVKDDDEYVSGVDKILRDSREEVHYAHKARRLKNQTNKKE